MIRVQKDGEIEFLAKALDQRGDLTRPHERALSFGGAHQRRDLEFSRRREDGFQQNQIGNVEMSHGDLFFMRLP
jgi:hypothetical protein